jgi:hypothetical protein
MLFMGCIMSLFNKKTTAGNFHTRIVSITQQSANTIVTKRKESLDEVKKQIDIHVGNLVNKLIHNTFELIESVAHATSCVTIARFDKPDKIIIINSHNPKEFKHQLSNLTLNDLTSISNKRMIQIKYNGFDFTGDDSIIMPSVNSIMTSIQTVNDLKPFTFKIGKELSTNAAPFTVIIVDWSV